MPTGSSQPSIAARRPGGLLAPTINTQPWSTRPASTQASIKDLIAERTHTSPRPPPSPALSESGFSLFDTSATPGSTTFHFEAHHHFPFGDEPFTPDLAANAAAVMGDEYDERTSTSDDVILEPLRDHDDREPFPRASTPSFSPSQASFATDRLSVQSTTMTDFSTCSPSPSPSIGSVRMATVTRVPLRPLTNARESLGAHSVLSESVEDAPEDTEETIWDARALTRTSFVDRLPHDLEAILRGAQADGPDGDSARVDHDATVEAPARDEVRPAVPAKNAGTLPKSTSAQSHSSGESSTDPAIKPEDDAMRRLKSILGPKTRIISKAPWDADHDVDDIAPVKSVTGRRSFDVLSMTSSKASRPPTMKASKEPTSPAAKPARSQSLSTLLAGGLPTDVEMRMREPGLAGLGIGIETSPVLTPSESKRSLGSLKPSPSMPLGEPLPDVAAASLAAYAEKAMARPSMTRMGSSGRIPKVGRTPPPVLFDMVSSVQSLASPSAPAPPMSAPPTVTLFAHARAMTTSDSKASLPASIGSAPSTSPSPSTPRTLHALGSSPASPSAGSYFSAVPGPPAAAPGPGAESSRGFSGHRLISLEEARQRESERSAAAQRKAASTPPLETAIDRNTTRLKEPHTRESTSESLSSRRGVQSPSAIETGSPKAGLTPKALKPKKSGFLKRMMGGGEKHQERPQMPDTFRPSPRLSTSSSIPTLSTSTPASSLGQSSGLKAASALSPSASTGRISFLPPPPTDPSDRINKRVAAPALFLRPVSMAFSAGLPADFLANIHSPITEDTAISPSGSVLRPRTERLSPPLRSAPMPSVADPLVSPHASSFKSGASPSAPSVLFDDLSLCVSGTTTPSTPAFFGGFVPTSDAVGTVDQYAALRDEYASAKGAWARMQYELESQVKALESEVQRLRAGAERTCEKCGAEDGKAYDLRMSIMQRPRAKGSNGAGTLFGSTMVS